MDIFCVSWSLFLHHTIIKSTMDKKTFFDLLIKFERGECSKKEKNLLFAFYQAFQAENIMESWNITEKEKVKIQLFEQINQSIEFEETNQKRKLKTTQLLRIAAIFIGIFSTGYFFLLISNQSNYIGTSANAITLELEDGSIEIIQEDRTMSIFDKKGNKVGEQNKNQLLYTKKDSHKELVFNTLTVPYGKTFELQLSDGTIAYLNAGSSLKYPVQFVEDMERKVFLSGEVFMDVKKDSAHPFIVNLNNLSVRVLGTRFNINAYKEDEVAEIVLVEGSVGLYADTEEFDEETSKRLAPGYKASFDKKNGTIATESVTTDIYTSWIKGELVFRNMSFDNILKKLERHYNVKIINKNKDLSTEKFNASFGTAPLIREILMELRTIYDISYTVKDNVITIY